MSGKVVWKCKGNRCLWYEGSNPFGNAPICLYMEWKLKRMVMVKDLKDCESLKEVKCDS